MCRFVAYYRVSTDRQGRSGLGLEAQQEAVRTYLTGKGWPPVAEFTEVESGKRSDRPQLARAVEACRLHRATLVIAKLDRLARNVAFVSQLMESGVEFVACDFPQANRLTIHILAAVAEHEREMISVRTKAALAAAKARGTKLGGYRENAKVTDEARARSLDSRRKAAADRAARVQLMISELRAAGITSLGGIARALNARGVPTPSGGSTWLEMTVKRTLALLPRVCAPS